MKELTAIQWLFEKIRTETHTITEWEEIAIAAEAMEKEQIINAYSNNGMNEVDQRANAEQYYNETYKKII
jgi:hypothetical protein